MEGHTATVSVPTEVITRDPWEPQSPPLVTTNLNQQGFDTFEFDPLESKQYLEGLEAKLKRLKGKTREPTAKDMLKCLGQVKEDHLKTILDDSDTPYVSNHDPEEPVPPEHPAVVALQRKINPEKQALTTGELKKLVENDDLGKVTQEGAAKQEEDGKHEKDTEDTQPEDE